MKYENTYNTNYVYIQYVSRLIGTLILAAILKNNARISITGNTNIYNLGKNIWKKVTKLKQN